MLNVFSIFKSIQGESTRAGLASGFVRLAGCPLECSYCDTRDACESEGRPFGVEDLVCKVKELGPRLVEVTGGEPLAQEETPVLLTALCDAGFEVMLETSGAFPITNVDLRVRIVMDIKCPGSGMADRMHLDNLNHLVASRHEVKFVVSSKEDFDWSLSFCKKRGLDTAFEILLSPAYDRVTLDELAGWIMGSGVSYRMQPQLHKIIWTGPET